MKRNPHSTQEEALRKVLRNQRLKMKMRQIDLAMKLNTPQSFISKYEAGERLLTFTETISICKALQISPEELLEKYMPHHNT